MYIYNAWEEIITNAPIRAWKRNFKGNYDDEIDQPIFFVNIVVGVVFFSCCFIIYSCYRFKSFVFYVVGVVVDIVVVESGVCMMLLLFLLLLLTYLAIQTLDVVVVELKDSKVGQVIHSSRGQPDQRVVTQITKIKYLY